jgi:hypothetical protein
MGDTLLLGETEEQLGISYARKQEYGHKMTGGKDSEQSVVIWRRMCLTADLSKPAEYTRAVLNINITYGFG